MATLPSTMAASESAPGAERSENSSLELQSLQFDTTFTRLYDFKVAPDAGVPLAPLLDVNGTFYGTSSQGGSATANGEGAVYTVTPAGKETVLYSFQGPPDGQAPQAGLIDVNGLLYGTTAGGGSSGGDGTVFKITPAGVEGVIYRFKGSPDGEGPEGSLVDLSGVFYGTTVLGGNGSCASGLGCGTVFSVTAAGKEKVLYMFGGGTDGQAPSAGLINFNGALYGTTFAGASSTLGTVYKLTTAGAETILHRFTGHADGANPNAELIAVNGKLYGTAKMGGPANTGSVFAVTP